MYIKVLKHATQIFVKMRPQLYEKV